MGERNKKCTEQKELIILLVVSLETQRVNICAFTTYAGIVHTGFELFNGLFRRSAYKQKVWGICAK